MTVEFGVAIVAFISALLTAVITVLFNVYKLSEISKTQQQILDRQIAADQNRDKFQVVFPRRIRQLDDFLEWLRQLIELSNRLANYSQTLPKIPSIVRGSVEQQSEEMDDELISSIEREFEVEFTETRNEIMQQFFDTNSSYTYHRTLISVQKEFDNTSLVENLDRFVELTQLSANDPDAYLKQAPQVGALYREIMQTIEEKFG